MQAHTHRARLGCRGAQLAAQIVRLCHPVRTSPRSAAKTGRGSMKDCGASICRASSRRRVHSTLLGADTPDFYTALLHRAWDRSVQIDSFTEAREIFPNMVRAQSIVCRDMHDDAPAEEDPLAAWEGASFVEPDGDQDWLEWISKYVEDDATHEV